jgi:hypothetical protein
VGRGGGEKRKGEGRGVRERGERWVEEAEGGRRSQKKKTYGQNAASYVHPVRKPKRPPEILDHDDRVDDLEGDLDTRDEGGSRRDEEHGAPVSREAMEVRGEEGRKGVGGGAHVVDDDLEVGWLEEGGKKTCTKRNKTKTKHVQQE